MHLDQVITTVQHFTRHWPDIKRFPEEAARAAGDTDGGFERLLRATLEQSGVPGDVSLARELYFYDGRSGAVVPKHELDFVLRLSDGSCVLEAKAWSEVVDKDSIIVFLGKVLDFLAAPSFDELAETLTVGFIGLGGFTEAARRTMFSFGIVPFSKAGDDLSFRFLDIQLDILARRCASCGTPGAEEVRDARASIGPFVAFESKSLTSIVRIEADEAIVDLGRLRRGATLYEEARAAHAQALGAYRRISAPFRS